ncbi:hypothetical protein KKF19_00935 [Patescibacteria group bacterium]|nr:hypothetical protein [Patescibacteria group bacterium]
MLEIFKQNIWLIAVFIVILISLSIVGNYYFKNKDLIADGLIVEEEVITEEAIDAEDRFNQIINKEKEKCILDFNLDKLDFTEADSDSELPTILKRLLVMRAADQNNRDLCYYENREIDFELRKERCERDYDFFFVLTDKLKNGIGLEQYVTECREAFLPYILIEKEQKLTELPDDLDEIKAGLGAICENYHRSFQSKEPVIFDSTLMCDSQVEQEDDAATDRTTSCAGEFSDNIAYLIAVAKNDSILCESIPELRIYQYCKYYFSRDLSFFYDKFKASYCHNKVHKDFFPTK